MPPPPELSAPAGSFECVQAACDHGADAVYIGIGRYNLRARGANFSIDELGVVCEYVQKQHRKLYCALNILPDDGTLEEIEQTLRSRVWDGCRPDAFIVGDPGVMTICQYYQKGIPLHLSTQTGTFNSASARFWKQNGITRVILPREMSLGKIAAIVKNASMETEIFIHGAMCVSLSGRCLLGAYLQHRHANWGDCPQPCRLQYRIAASDDGGLDSPAWLTVEESIGASNEGHLAFILNSKDLNTISIIPEIVAAGVSSLKIEGRHKSPHYVASVVKVYREALDSCLTNPGRYSVKRNWIDELDKLDHRSYTTGFYGGDYALQEVGCSNVRSDYRIVGAVKALQNDGKAIVDVKNPFGVGETVNVLPVTAGKEPYILQLTSISDINGNPIQRAVTNRIVIVSTATRLRIGDMLRRKQIT